MIQWHTAIYLAHLMDTDNIHTGILVYEYTIPSCCGSKSTICVFSYHDTKKLYASKKN